MTPIQCLSEHISSLALEMAKFKSDNIVLGEILEQFLIVYEVLNKYIRSERNLVTAIIDGEDAKIVADFFGIELDKIKE